MGQGCLELWSAPPRQGARLNGRLGLKADWGSRPESYRPNTAFVRSRIGILAVAVMLVLLLPHYFAVAVIIVTDTTY